LASFTRTIGGDFGVDPNSIPARTSSIVALAVL
jgi:hypothetical protein